MPHIKLSNLQNINYPILQDGVKFKYEAVSEHESLIAVTIENKNFFLTKTFKKSSYLIKYEKSTRISPISYIIKALNSYHKVTNSELIFSNLNINMPHESLENSYLKDIEFFLKNNWNNNLDVLIEIGFGSGRHLLHQAKQNPNKLIIGIEIHKTSIEKVLKQLELQNITNVLILDFDARIFLELLQSQLASKIFVHFPVPWDKKAHRRVFSETFLNEALRVLKKDGTLELRTDSKEYFDYSLEIALTQNRANISIFKNQDIEISSKYEDRWKRFNKDIYDLTVKNCFESKNKENFTNFEFDFFVNTDNLEEKISSYSKNVEEFLLTFYKLYKIGTKDYLLKVTMGDFNMPQTKYIEIINNKAIYFDKFPIASSATIKAHNRIKEILS
ncbi:MAG: tRNA (guanosine(46)-N7)-methyltransferase TrmB [Campylobacterales bacterium]|nr:tRNA (guanosine(46)-N7)-methyltransferase TrmB [Campylobacterales bacterium]